MRSWRLKPLQQQKDKPHTLSVFCMWAMLALAINKAPHFIAIQLLQARAFRLECLHQRDRFYGVAKKRYSITIKEQRGFPRTPSYYVRQQKKGVAAHHSGHEPTRIRCGRFWEVTHLSSCASTNSLLSLSFWTGIIFAYGTSFFASFDKAASIAVSNRPSRSTRVNTSRAGSIKQSTCSATSLSSLDAIAPRARNSTP